MSLKDTYTSIDRGADRSPALDWGNTASVHVKVLGTHKRKTAGDYDRHGTAKMGAGVTKAVASKGVSIAQNVTSSVSLPSWVAAGGTAAVGSTAGAGLLIASGTLVLADAVASGVSVYKTHKHINRLQEIQSKSPGSYHCNGSRTDHDYIHSTILPYIINKKKMKRRRKGESAVPIVGGMLALAETGSKSIWKRLRGTRGSQRSLHAELLTRHLITCKRCDLAQEIVCSLFSRQEMEVLKMMDSANAGPIIFGKMASK